MPRKEKAKYHVIGGPGPELSDELKKKACLKVCEQSEGLEDARILLCMLGLVDDQVRWPSVPVDPRGVPKPSSRPVAAPLPSSRYGGGSS